MTAAGAFFHYRNPISETERWFLSVPALCHNLYAVANFNFPADQHLCKNPLPGHDTVSHCFENMTSVVADLANLGNLKKNLKAGLQLCADGK
jgi:hypothetical protein